MQRKLRWGCLSTAQFARNTFLPAVPACEHAELYAIASRDAERARAAAAKLGIPHAYSTYEELLADPAVDVVYIPLPNHLHLEWSVRAAAAGKHVLCEKPLALNAGEVKELMAAREKYGVEIQEAFMVRTHPQWLRARELVRSGVIGELRAVQGFFSYDNRDPENVRNRYVDGGGALYDIGCYTITTSRMLFGQEPRRVIGLIERDPDFRVDRLTSAIFDYPGGQAVWTVGTQVVPCQRVQAIGTKGRIEVEIPFNAPNDRPARILIDPTGDLTGADIRVEEFPVCDQYTIEADTFSRAIIEGAAVAVPLEDSLANMAAIDAVFRSAASGNWEAPTL